MNPGTGDMIHKLFHTIFTIKNIFNYLVNLQDVSLLSKHYKRFLTFIHLTMNGLFKV